MRARALDNNECLVTTKYGVSHRGLDMVKYNMVTKEGETCNITAHTEGIVVWRQTGQKNNKNAKGNASYGNCVKLKHPNGYYTLYAHLKNVDVKLNQKVSKGQKLGYMGNTGKAWGAHLHWEVRDVKDNRINPTPYIDADLPLMRTEYQVYDNVKNKWLSKVKAGSNDYAGNFGNGISGVKISNLTYQVHDKVKKKWLLWVSGSSSYAGNLPNDIDGIRIKGATYRAHIKGQGWLSWVSKADDTSDGYAGIYGKTIDAIQIK